MLKRRVEALTDRQRRVVREMSPNMSVRLPDIIADYIGGAFGNGGWPVKAMGRAYVMDTVMSHYRFVPSSSGEDKALMLIWSREPGYRATDYLSYPPGTCYELVRA